MMLFDPNNINDFSSFPIDKEADYGGSDQKRYELIIEYSYNKLFNRDIMRGDE